MARVSDRLARAVTVGPIATRTTLPASGAAWRRMRFNVVKVDLGGPRSGWFSVGNAHCLGEVMRLRAAPLVRKFPGNHLQNHFQNDLQKFFGGVRKQRWPTQSNHRAGEHGRQRPGQALVQRIVRLRTGEFAPGQAARRLEATSYLLQATTPLGQLFGWINATNL